MQYQYQLRLFEHGAEVSNTPVVCPQETLICPVVGETVGDWLVVGVISHSDAERCLRVERINFGFGTSAETHFEIGRS